MKPKILSKDPASRRLRAFVLLVLGAVALPSLALSGFGLIAIENERSATEERVRSLYGPVARKLAAGIQADNEKLAAEAAGALEDFAAWARRERSSPGARFETLRTSHPELAGWFAFDGERRLWPRESADLGRSTSSACEEMTRDGRAQRGRKDLDAALATWEEMLRRCADTVDWRGYDPSLGAGLALMELTPSESLPERLPSLRLLVDALDRVGSPAAADQRRFVAERLLERLQDWPAGARGPEFALVRDRLEAVRVGRSPDGPAGLVWEKGASGSMLSLRWRRGAWVAGASIAPAVLEFRLAAELDKQGIGHQVKAHVVRAGDETEQAGGLTAGQAWLGQGPDAWRLDLRLQGTEALDDLAGSRTTLYVWLLAVLVLALLAGIGATLAIMYRETRLSRLKTDFVSNISHELRTPLTSIRLYTDTLLMGRVADEADREECLRVIDAESKRLSRLVERILDFARMDAGRRAYRMSEVELGALLQRAVEACRPLLDEGGFALEQELDGELPPLWADAEAMEEAVVNLLHNAIKYSGQSRWIGIRALASHDWIHLEVADRGLGIPRAEQARIFDKFYRVETELSGQISGSGLGLSLVRYIVDAHGGRVELDSEPGQGSTFRLVLPAREGQGVGR